jgi:hypothetical protein
MVVVGVTGHSDLTSRLIDLVRHDIADQLRPRAADLVGMTCLARGADQAFADAVLELVGGPRSRRSGQRLFHRHLRSRQSQTL